MQIRELHLIESLGSLQCLTGGIGLDRQMKDVVLLEYDDFIIATLYFAKDDPEKLLNAVERLIRLGAAGLAFKSVYYDSLPDSVLALAEAHQFPIFKFDNIYMEDVILSISEYIRHRQEYSQFEEPIFRIIQGTSDAYGSTEQLCARMNPGRQKYMCAAYVHAADIHVDWTSPLKSALQLRTYRELTGNLRFLQFRRGFYVICNYPEEVPLSQVGSTILDTLRKLGCNTDLLCIGVGSFYQKAEDFDIVVIEAFNTLLTALLKNQQLMTYPDLKLYRAVFPIVRERTCRQAMLNLLEELETYDRESNAGFLVNTLKTHAECGYDIKKTAEVMGQHPNTIRYRLKKICDLTASDREYDHALFIMGEFLRIDALSSSIF